MSEQETGNMAPEGQNNGSSTEAKQDAEMTLAMFDALGPVIEGQPIGTVIVTLTLVLGGLLSSANLTDEQRRAGVNIVIGLASRLSFDIGMTPQDMVEQIMLSFDSAEA